MSKEAYTVGGVRIESYDGSDNEFVVGYHFHTYRDSGHLHPVLPIGRINTIGNVASTKLVYVDLPKHMSKVDAFNFMVNHPRFEEYRDQMVANPYGAKANQAAENKALKDRLAELEAELAKLQGESPVVTEDMTDDERELTELGVS